MTNLAKLARPYAKAAFEYALAHQQLDEWSNMLQLLALRVNEPALVTVLKNPRYSIEQLTELGLILGQDILTEAAKNFIKIIAKHRRLLALPAIAELYAQFRATAEKTLVAQVKSVIPLTAADKKQLQLKLSAKFGRHMVLDCELEPELVAGLVIKVGDQVIDGSIRGQLQRLREAIIGSV